MTSPLVNFVISTAEKEASSCRKSTKHCSQWNVF